MVVEPPLQEIVPDDEEAVTADGWVMVMDVVEKQPLLSVTVKE
jgi:hypothetical protein